MTSISPQPDPKSTTSPLPLIPDSNQDLTSELTLLAGQINAAQHRFLTLLAALIEREAWGGSGIKSPAHWLNYYCGIDLGAAREKVRVAKALQSLPQIDAAFASGAISYSKVRAMTRSATPENEDLLLNIARHGTAQHVENTVRQHQRVRRLNAREQANGTGEDASRPQHKARELSYFYDEDGMLEVRGRFAPEEGALVVKALDCALESIEREQQCEKAGAEKTFQRKREASSDNQNNEAEAPASSADVSAETSAPGSDPEVDTDAVSPPTFPQKRADALVQIAEGFLAAARWNSDSDSNRLNNADKYQVLIHLDARTNSVASKLRTPMTAHIDDGPALPPSTMKRLACDASLVAVTRDKSGNVLNIGRKSRCVSPALRRALKIRDDGCCRYPGCGQTRYVDAHHIRHWCDGGETNLDNLVLLCRHHHRALHEGIFSIDQDLRFSDRHGKEIKPALYPQFPAPTSALSAPNIDSTTAVTLWHGESMDYNLAVAALQDRDSNSNALKQTPHPAPPAC